MLTLSTTLVALLATVGALALGWRLGAHRRWPWIAAAALAFVALWFATHQWSDLAYRLITWLDYPFYQRASVSFAVLIFAAICLRHIRLPLVRATLALVALGYAGHCFADLASPLVYRGAIAALDDDRTSLKPLSQSSGWSCGAASTATFLRLHGIPASEREVALLSGTSPIMGTDTIGDCRAIAILGAPYGLRPHMRTRLTAQDVDTISTPCVFEWRMGAGLWHVAVIAAIRPDAVEVDDPLYGHETWTRQELLDKWVGIVVEAELCVALQARVAQASRLWPAALSRVRSCHSEKTPAGR